ncbi:hypothetical protein ACROYT_G027694 [Oculina patagonica]
MIFSTDGLAHTIATNPLTPAYTTTSGTPPEVQIICPFVKTGIQQYSKQRPCPVNYCIEVSRTTSSLWGGASRGWNGVTEIRHFENENDHYTSLPFGNHHRSLHNEKTSEPLPSNLSPVASVFTSQGTLPVVENRSIQGMDNEETRNIKNLFGICSVQKIKVRGSDGNLNDLLAMLDTGSNTSLLSKRAARQLGLSGSKTHLTMNLAGGQKKAEVSEMIEIELENIEH